MHCGIGPQNDCQFVTIGFLKLKSAPFVFGCDAPDRLVGGSGRLGRGNSLPIPNIPHPSPVLDSFLLEFGYYGIYLLSYRCSILSH